VYLFSKASQLSSREHSCVQLHMVQFNPPLKLLKDLAHPHNLSVLSVLSNANRLFFLPHRAYLNIDVSQHTNYSCG